MHFERASICCCICACWAGVGSPPFGNSFWQALRADWNVGELGSIPIPEPNRMTPWPFGSGKFFTPCLRIQAENFAPSAAFPTFIAIWNWPPGPPPEPPKALFPEPESLRVVDVAVVEVVGGEAMLATPGEPEPPPQPAKSSESTAAAAAEPMAGGRYRMAFGSFCERQRRLRIER
jgi:hypothetical protein